METKPNSIILGLFFIGAMFRAVGVVMIPAVLFGMAGLGVIHLIEIGQDRQDAWQGYCNGDFCAETLEELEEIDCRETKKMGGECRKYKKSSKPQAAKSGHHEEPSNQYDHAGDKAVELLKLLGEGGGSATGSKEVLPAGAGR